MPPVSSVLAFSECTTTPAARLGSLFFSRSALNGSKQSSKHFFAASCLALGTRAREKAASSRRRSLILVERRAHSYTSRSRRYA
ncbi:hypothetical protein TSAR_009304 [Trichomalopsis sarcophagae]|uniref:Uncharacterized protein n=1 Tax=Trichomalopsis sarcophagae TaxID=543379 RepID=A0A232F5Y4_9HYME|nr:hypothetical protein TSAR_009304 [Trichomalopsis sarcophagae]